MNPETVAALCVNSRSHYHELPGVECFDVRRDVRTFGGGCPVVAHPPCRAWSAKCAHQAKPPPGEKELGPLCVDWLRKCGGVLEHPAHSRLFDFCDIPKPNEPARGGLWSMWVSQSWFGCTMRKNTWLVFSGVERAAVELPFVLHDGSADYRKWQLMSKAQRSLTPLTMALWLVEIARKSRIESVPVGTCRNARIDPLCAASQR